ncbi:Mif2/CENP-C like-domain-containing protein [Armillaria borealis]|uniref:Mif2/CENP-C like-domain-containing protein n=1 Tax=Armillaria borealis TaxID=47425 RepID=A0AA39JB69_9AGAR|nr:Mif2/CENP-C like-domain-containing protein [Armillaria borealis]
MTTSPDRSPPASVSDFVDISGSENGSDVAVSTVVEGTASPGMTIIVDDYEHSAVGKAEGEPSETLEDDTRSLKSSSPSVCDSDITVTPQDVAGSSARLDPSNSHSSRRKKNARKGIKPSVYEEEGVSFASDVMVFGGKNEAKRRVVFPAEMVDMSLNKSVDGGFSFQKTFGEGDFIAAGHLQVSSQKPVKSAKDNAYIFYVIEGVVNVRIHQTYHTVSAGGMFMVPRGNTYSIENVSDKPSKLVFTQARESAVASDGEDPMRLDRKSSLPHELTTSKAFILLGWLFERFLKRFAVYRKLLLIWSKRARFMFHQHMHGGRAYALFFVLGLLLRSMPFPGKSSLTPPRVNIQFIRDSSRS